MNNLSNDARAILDAGRDLDGAGDLERARVRKALFATIAAGGAVIATSGTAAGSAATSVPAATTSLLGKLLLPLVVVIAGGVGGTIAWNAKRLPTPAPVVAPAPVAPPSIVVVPVPIGVPAPTVAPRAVATRSHRAHVAAPARAEAPANRLAEETALLASANAELRSGDARRSLALLDNYDRRYPSGMLREEVLATRVIARCQLGGTPDAAARRGAGAFLAKHPSSPLATRVRSSCGQ